MWTKFPNRCSRFILNTQTIHLLTDEELLNFVMKISSSQKCVQFIVVIWGICIIFIYFVVRQAVTEKLNALREGTWNSVHTCTLGTDENVLCKSKKPFPQQTVNLLELPGISLDCSMPEPLGMVVGMLILICAVDFPWYSSGSHSPLHPFSTPKYWHCLNTLPQLTLETLTWKITLLANWNTSSVIAHLYIFSSKTDVLIILQISRMQWHFCCSPPWIFLVS